MKSIYKDRHSSFPREPEDRKAYAGEYLEYRNRLGAGMVRPLAAVTAAASLGLGLTVDQALDPSFPWLSPVRLGLTLIGAACFLLTFFGRFRKNRLILLHVLYGSALLSWAFIAGRPAHAPHYVSCLLIVALVCPFLPFRFATAAGYYAAAALLFLSGTALRPADAAAPAGDYSLVLLAAAGIVGAAFSRMADAYRFSTCVNDIRRDLAYQRLHQIIEFLPDATFVIDNRGRLIAWNRAVEELTGWPAEKMIGKGNYEYALPFYKERRPVMIDLVITQDHSLDHMYAYVTRNADRFESESFIPHLKPGGACLYNTARTLYGSDGAVIGAIESIRDITDQKMAAKALEESRRHLAEVIDFFPDAAFVLDRDEKVMLWNRGMEELSGVKAADIIGRGDYAYAVPFYGERRPVLANMALHWNEDYLDKYISVKKREDGVLISESFHPGLKGGIFLSGTARVLNDADGNPAGVIEALRDITDVKTAENHLMAARRAAEDASRAKSDFLARMSHELRTPLNAILGYSRILGKAENMTEDQQDGLRVIHQSGVHLLTLINDVLDFSKIEAGKLDLAPTDTALRPFLDNIVDIMKISAKQKGLRFDVEPADDLPRFIRLDQNRLRQILLNLLSNAVKYTDAGCVRFRITGAAHDAAAEPRVALAFEVEDTGVGISKHQLETIFNPFEQAGKEIGRAAGAGLGLAISRRLADLMGGAIAVKSVPGKGSVFSFHISAPVLRDMRLPEATAPDAVTGYAGRRRTILVTDDNAANRNVVGMMLSQLGFQVVCAAGGRDAVSKTVQDRPDLILMDLIMPEVSGFEAAKRIRAMPGFERIPVIAVSASHIDTGRQEAEKNGFNAYLPKPIDERKLIETVGTLLNLTWVHDQPAAGDRRKGDMPVPADMVPPPPDTLKTIHDLAMLGKMKPIRAAADQLKTMDAAYAPFAERLKLLAKSFEDKEIAAMMETFLKKDAK